MKDENIENSTRELTYKNSEHPLTAYSIAEIYSIRKESINSATDQIYKKLGKKFQRIKKLRSQVNGQAIMTTEYDYESPTIRKDFKKLHDMYNVVSKCSLITRKRVQKMRKKVDRAKAEMQNDESAAVREIDINKTSIKPSANGNTTASLVVTGSTSVTNLTKQTK